MKTFAQFLPLAAVFALAACSSVSVTTTYDHHAPFGKYKTYALAPAKHDQRLAPSGETALRDSLRRHLAERGLHETSQSQASLDIVRHVFLHTKVSVQQYTDMGYYHSGMWPYNYGYYGMWAGAPRVYTDVTHYTEGTLVLDFVDAKTKKLVFRGTGVAVVGAPGTNDRKIDEAVEKIVAEYPGGAMR